MSISDHKIKHARATVNALSAESQLASIQDRYRAIALLGRSAENDAELNTLRDAMHTQTDFLLDAVAAQAHRMHYPAETAFAAISINASACSEVIHSL